MGAQQQYPGYKVKQYNIIIDALGVCILKELEKSMKEGVGVKGGKIFRDACRKLFCRSLNLSLSKPCHPATFSHTNPVNISEI